MKKVSLIGSTGSIGRQTLDVVSAHPSDLQVVALAAGSKSLDLLANQIQTFLPEVVAVPDEGSVRELKTHLASYQQNPEIVFGETGLNIVATHSQAEILVNGVMGFLGLKPTLDAIKMGKTIALANKETLVAAGSLVMQAAKKYGARIIPVDSEHSAIYQCLNGYAARDLRTIWLTASGGPFRTWTYEQIQNATIDDALQHPNWAMGKKITIDSATLMNKGLEIIEARWLFDIAVDKIRVVVHPQSILHSAVEFEDGSIIGQFGVPDMRLPIHYALFYPDRVASSKVPRLDLAALSQLTFEEPDLRRFPCLQLAQAVAQEDTTLPSILNAANEVIVEAYLNQRIRFGDIPLWLKRILHEHRPISNPELEDILESDCWARRQVERQIALLV